MKQRLTHLLAAGLLLSGLSVGMFAQEQDDKNQKDRSKNPVAMTMTGCLTKEAAGTYTLTDEKTGMKTTVTGPAALEQHSANHTVTLTGESKNDASGKPVFEVSKIQHVADTCKGPGQ